MLTTWPDYLVDAAQRSVLFLDLLRRRGNEQLETAAVPLSTVLRFEHEVLMDGRSLPRPINYWLSRITAPAGIVLDGHKRPVVVIDPRAGQVSGIGGFKSDSEIGAALRAKLQKCLHAIVDVGDPLTAQAWTLSDRLATLLAMPARAQRTY